jgi:hypothetical protein
MPSVTALLVQFLAIYNCSTSQIKLREYIKQYKSDEEDYANKYVLTPWQRGDRWPLKFKQELIISILEGADISKITIGNIIGDDEKSVIIDGGHRTRTLAEFMDNEWSIKIGNDTVWYNKEIDPASSGVRSFTKEEKKYFDNKRLDIVEYVDCTDEDCRTLFVKLQNSAPMSVSDMINSFPSHLVDFLRTMCETLKEVNGETLSVEEHFKNIKGLENPGKNLVLHQLVALFTIFNPLVTVSEPDTENENESDSDSDSESDSESDSDNDNDSEIIQAMKCTKMGQTREAPTLKYVERYGFKTQLTEDVKSKFNEVIEYILNYAYDNKKSVSASYIYTLVHAREYFGERFNVTKYTKLTDDSTKYLDLKKKEIKTYKTSGSDAAKILAREANLLNAKYGGTLDRFANTKTAGGANYNGMKTRLEIVKAHCFN